ncbi:MAG: hypothetical protein ACO1SV_21535 [Fimbriimonas sp.]
MADGSYDPGLSTDRDRLRRELGDVGTLKDDAGAEVYLVPDATYDAMLRDHGYNEALARLAEGLAAEKAQEPVEYDDEGKVRVRWTDRIKTWLTIADRARAKSLQTAHIVDSNFASYHGGGPDVSGLRL